MNYPVVGVSISLLSFVLVVRTSQCQAFDPQIRRFGFKNGFHRELLTVIELNAINGCKILIEETLPSGMFVDVDQLGIIANHSVPKVLSKSDTNVEWPAQKADPQHLLVYPSILPYKMRENHYQLSVKVPIHLRYHQPALGKAFETISLPPPNILISCSDDRIAEGCKHNVLNAPCDETQNEMCEWMNITNEKLSKESLDFKVPIGMMNHRSAVTIATALSTLGGTAWTIIAMMKSPK